MDLYGEVYEYPTMSMALNKGHLLELIDGLRAANKSLMKDLEQYEGVIKVMETDWQKLEGVDILYNSPEDAVYYLPPDDDNDCWGGYVRGVEGSYEFNHGVGWIYIEDEYVFMGEVICLEDLKKELYEE